MIHKARKVIAIVYRIVVSLIFIFVLYKSHKKYDAGTGRYFEPDIRV